MSEPRPRWKQDFPIKWENDHYVTRRELAKFLTLGSALLVGASALIALVGRLRRKPATPRIRLPGASQLAPGESLLFRYPTDEDPCLLVRGRDGRWLAFSQVCTHLSCAIVYRPQRDALFCPCHHGVFSVAEGVPTAGPPTRRLPRIRLEEWGGELWAVGVEV
ncbi:MAG TPA: Rieske 2Fe-2S domain-containing protein [Polyangia bacterium]|nr:Rieske 2Fe-2S domain-containing protein [Polyangia bacterium]